MKIRHIIPLLFCIFVFCCSVCAAESAKLSTPEQQELQKVFEQAGDIQKAGNLDKAVELYSAVISRNQDNGDAYLNRGLIYGQQGKLDLAIADMRQVNRLKPEFALAYGLLGKYLILHDKYIEARAPCQKAHELDIDSFAWTLNLGHACMLTGDERSAEIYYRKTLTMVSSEDDYKGILASFDRRIAKGWQKDSAVRWKQWFMDAYQRAEPPRLVVQTGHVGEVFSVAFSPDGRTMVSGSKDKTIRLWDVATGRELHRFTGHEAAVKCVAFSPDGKTLVSGSGDKTIRLWDVATGRKLCTLSGDEYSVQSVAFSPDGKTVVSGGWDNTLKLWDVGTGQELRSFHGHTKTVESVVFSQDGKIVVSASHDNTLKLWDVGTGRVLRTLAGHMGRVNSLAVSPDGKTLVSASHDETLKLWDVATGREFRALTGHSNKVFSAAFSPDGKTVVSGGRDKTIKIWDVATGRELRSFRGHTDDVNSVAFSLDGKTLVSGSDDKTIRRWDIVTGNELLSQGYAEEVRTVAFSPDGNTVASGTNEKTLANIGTFKLWNLAIGREPRTLAGHGDNVTCVAFSPDGKTVVSGSEDTNIKLWDVATGRELNIFTGHSGAVLSVAFSPDGKTVVSGSIGTIKLWDIATGQELRSFTANDGMFHKVWSVVFSSDGKTVASGSDDTTIKLWDVATGRLLRTLAGHNSTIFSVAFSPDGKTVASGSLRGTVKLWDVATGRELHTYAVSREVTSVAFSPDGKTILWGGADETLTLWDVATSRELRRLVGHEDWVYSIAISPDGKTLMSGSADKSIKLWEIASGRLLATLTSFTDGRWAVTDPEGRFDASNGGDNPHLHWVFENTPIDLAQLKDRYYDPGLLQKVMGYGKEPLRTVPKFEDALLHHWPEVAVDRDKLNPLHLNIKLTDRGDGYGRVWVRLNGKEVTADATAGQKLSGKTASLSLDLDPDRLLPGDNRIDVVAWPGVGHIPSPAAQVFVSGAAVRGEIIRIGDTKAPAAEPVTLHAIVMGVGRYVGANLRLAFAGKDAADFAQALELGGARLFGAERVRLHSLSDHAQEGVNVPADRLPTRDNLRLAFEIVAKEAKAGDILVVYLAGHGVMTPGAAGEADYYYLTREAQSTDLSDPAVRKLWGISSSELTDWIKQIKAGKQVLVLDTCAAGGAIEKMVAKRQIPGAQVIAIEQLKDRTGVHILAGAAADKVSYEATQFGQGLLTYALLTGMKGAALKDEIIDVQSLFQYTRNEVPKLARQIGGVQEPRLSSPQGESFAIGRMAEDDRRRVPLAQIKPMIQRASFQDEARGKDLLKLSQRFNDRLKLETYSTARGSVVYVDAEDFPEAWQVSGRYTKAEKGIRVKMWLFQGDAEKAAFDVLLPLDEAGQTDILLAATLKMMGDAIGGK